MDPELVAEIEQMYHFQGFSVGHIAQELFLDEDIIKDVLGLS